MRSVLSEIELGEAFGEDTARLSNDQWRSPDTQRAYAAPVKPEPRTHITSSPSEGRSIVSLPPPELLPQQVVTLRATSVASTVLSPADNEAHTVAENNSSESSVVELPGVMVPHTTRAEDPFESVVKTNSWTTDTPVSTAVEVNNPNTVVV